jgi:ABC-2 type transport system ATP-binding protein
VLRACVDASLKLTHFEPRRPHLHDAFVALVGEERAADMESEDA